MSPKVQKNEAIRDCWCFNDLVQLSVAVVENEQQYQSTNYGEGLTRGQFVPLLWLFWSYC